MTLPMFLVPDVDARPLEVTGPEARHAVTVKRLGVGEALQLTDGRGGLVTGTIAEAGKDRMRIDVLSSTLVPAATPQVTVVQALPKSDRSELAVDLATQAGADRIVPWQAHRCVARWQGAKVAKGQRKWSDAALAAAKQSRRPWVPEVEPLASTADVEDLIRRTVAEGGVAAVLHEAEDREFASVGWSAAPAVVFIVGPEGGVSEEELDRFLAAGAVTVKLGPQVLRTASAAMVALSALGALTGRWSAAPESTSHPQPR